MATFFEIGHDMGNLATLSSITATRLYTTAGAIYFRETDYDVIISLDHMKKVQFGQL